MQKQEKKDKEKKSSSQPLIAGLSFYLNQYAKKPSNSSTAKHSEDKPKENSNKTEGAAISESTKKKNKDKPKKLDQKGEEDGQSKNKDFGKNKKLQKPHFWWTQYDTASHTKLFVTPEKPWYEQYSSFVKRFSNSQEKTDEFKGAEVSDQEYSIIKKSMESAYNQEVKVYQEELAKLGMATDQKWLNSVISSGTWSDKIAALTLRIQESPYHNLENLDILVGIAEKKDLRVSFLALEAIKDLLVHNLLPDNDHLYFLDHYRPIITSSAMKMDTGIILWFEDQLKQRMLKVINLLDNALKANILHFRKQSLDVLSGLLLKKPEQEHKILILIINKLGDSDGTITTKTMDIIKQLIYEHPAMKLVIIKELKNFIYQPNLKIISIYHAVVLLLKIPVSFKDSVDVPLQLVDCYISLFDKALQAKKDGSRLLSGLLQGINKTFHLLTDVSPLTKYLDVLFRLVHTAPSFAASIQALVLISYMALSSIEQKKSKKDGKADTTTDGNDSLTQVQDRYYTALYAKLQSEQVMESGKNTLFLNLLYRSLKLDANELRIAAFFKRILMMTSYIAAELTAGFLFIISEVVNYRPQLKAILKLPDKNNTTGKTKQRKQSKKDKNNEDDEEDNEGDSYGVFDNFDANKRNPAFACLNDSYPILSEQTLLTRHYHPSVQAFAISLFNDPSHQIVYKGEDPLVDFSLVAFLNRFAYKNPKQKVIDELKSQQKKVREEEQPIHQEYELWKKNHPGEQLDLSTIAPEKQFYYKYFEDRDRLRAEGIIKPSRKDKGEDDDDEDDEVDEDEIDAFADELAEDMMKQDAKSRGEDLGDDDYDDDDAEGGFDDFGDFDDNDDDIDLDNDEDFGDFEVDEDEEEEEEEEIPVKKGKKKEEKSKKRKHGEDEIDFSSSALDFQDFVNEQKNKSKNKKDKKGKRKNDDDDDYPEPEIYHDEFDEMDDDEDDLALMMEEESKNSKKKNQSKKKNNKKRGHDDDDDEMDVDAGDDAFADADLYEDQMEDNVQQYTFGKKPSAGKTESQGNSQKDKKNFHKSRNNNNNRRNNKNHHHRRN